jgi:hypothetical protein
MDIILMRPVCFSVYSRAKPMLFKEIIAMVEYNLNNRLLCSSYARGSDKLPPLIIGKYLKFIKNIRRLPTNCEADMNPWMTAKIYEGYLTQLGRKLTVKNCKI